jgi:hypothetical protein
MPVFKQVPWLRRFLFRLSLKRLCPPLTWSNLPAFLPREQSDLSWLEPGSPPQNLVKIWVLLATASQWSILHAWPSEEPPDLSVLEPDGPPWVAFGHRSLGSASLSGYLGTYLIWVGSIQIAPLGLQVKSSFSSPPWDLILGRSLQYMNIVRC